MTTSSPNASATRFRLGEWVVDANSHELVSADHQTRLQPRQMQLLLRLASEPGQLVRREQLLDAVWGRREVNDEVLSRAIAELRQTLNDDPRAPRYIETLPKLGYRLVATIESCAVDLRPALAETASPPLVSSALNSDQDDLPAKGFAPAIFVFMAAVAILVVLLATMLPPAPGDSQHATDLRARLDRARPFATGVGYDQSARFSADGRLIAWSASTADQNKANIWLASHDGSSRRQLTHGDAWDLSPVFIDSDKSLLFARYDHDHCELRRQSIIASDSVHIADCAPPPATSRIDVSADGNTVAFVRQIDPGGRSGIGLLTLASGAQTTLTDPGADSFHDVNPRFSNDGRQIAFSRGRNGEQRLWIAPLATPARARSLMTSNGVLYGAAWLPDDVALILAGDLFGYRALYRIDAATGALEFLGARGARYPDVAADGSIVYEIADYQANLWLQDLHDSTKEPIPLTQSQRYNNQPTFSPDGKSLAFASNRDGLEAVWLANADGSQAHRLALDPGLRWVRPSWSTDGHRLLVTAILNRNEGAECLPYACTSDDSDLYDYDLRSNRAARIEHLGENARYAHWSGDGTWLYYLRREGERNRLWRITARRDDSPRLVMDASIEAYDVSANHLVVNIQGDPGLRVCNLDGRDCHRILHESLASGARLAYADYWTLSGESIFFVARFPNGVSRMQKMDLSTESIVDVSPNTPNTLAPALAASPDGRSLVFSRNDRISIDLYLGDSAPSDTQRQAH